MSNAGAKLSTRELLSNFKKVDDESVEESLCKNIKKDFKDLSAEGYNSLTHSLSILPEALEAF